MNNPAKNGALLTLGVIGAVVAASIVKRGTGSMARSRTSGDTQAAVRAEVLRLLAMAEIGAGARLDAFSDRLAGGGPIDAEDLADAVAAAEARLEDAEYELKNDRIREHRVGNRADRDHYRRVLLAIRRLKPSR